VPLGVGIQALHLGPVHNGEKVKNLWKIVVKMLTHLHCWWITLVVSIFAKDLMEAKEGSKCFHWGGTTRVRRCTRQVVR
jgi:hypothetical protein